MADRERELRTRIAASPGDAEALRELAELVGAGRGRKDEAVELWSGYVHLAEPEDTAEALLALGRAQVEARRNDEAIRTLRRCAEDAPEFFPVFDLLGELLRQAGRLEEAVETLQRAVELDATAVRPRLALVGCLDALDRPREAEATLAAVRALGSSDPAVLALVQELMRRRE